MALRGMSRDRMFGIIFTVVSTLVQHVSAQATTPLQYNVLEEEPRRTFIGNVKRDANLSLFYSEYELAQVEFNFRSNSASSSMFILTESTGDMWTGIRIDREEICQYSSSCDIELDVKITPFQYFRILKVIVHITDINDHAPTYPTERMALDIMENVQPIASFTLPAAEDPDSGELGVWMYELESDTNKFDLEETTQADGTRDVSLLLLEQLDREDETFYSVTVIAWDGGNPQKSGTLIVDITVTDFNDNNPVFDEYQYNVEIYENLPSMTPVAQVHATDQDFGVNGIVMYEFAQHTQQTYGSIFGINNSTGEIYIKGNVDYERDKVFHLNVMATDLGPNSLPAFAKVTIDVLDTNDHSPEITVTTFTGREYAEVPENVPRDHFVAHIAVADPDEGNNGEFHCNLDDGDNFFLEKMSDTGFKIVTLREFDREVRAQYEVVLRCQDHGNPQQTSTELIVIKIADDNDNDPYFILPPGASMYNVSMRENNTLNHVILRVNASDRDVNANAALKYEIRGIRGTNSETIKIDQMTGVVRANHEFDYERETVHYYVITASDHGDPIRYADVELQLNIVNINDEYPTFTQSSYSFKVMENEYPGAVIGVVTATDQDIYPFNIVSYSLQPRGPAAVGKFSINAKTGEITSNQILDHEENSVLFLSAVAMNDHYPNMLRVANVTIHVQDENDNAPTIDFPNEPNNTAQVPTRLDKGDIVTLIKAHDPDAGNNSYLTYQISNGNENNGFHIDEVTGVISAATYIESKHLQRHKLVVMVKDHGHPEKTAIASLNILFNKSVPIASSQAGGSLLEGSTLMIVVGICAGVVLLVLVIALAVCCVKAKQRRQHKKQIYNCRIQEVKKSITNGDVQQRELHPSCHCSDSGSDASIDNSHLGSKTKDPGTKKEVTFSLDMDDGYIDKIPPDWPLQETKIIENPLADTNEVIHLEAPTSRGMYRVGRIQHDRGKTYYPVERPPHRYPPRLRSPHPFVDSPSKEPPITQETLQMHDMLSQAIADLDSESGCSGTDSGRGPSEEGDHHYAAQLEPFLPAVDPRTGVPIWIIQYFAELRRRQRLVDQGAVDPTVLGAESPLPPLPERSLARDALYNSTPITSPLRHYDPQQLLATMYRHYQPSLPQVPEMQDVNYSGPFGDGRQVSRCASDSVRESGQDRDVLAAAAGVHKRHSHSGVGSSSTRPHRHPSLESSHSADYPSTSRSSAIQQPRYMSPLEKVMKMQSGLARGADACSETPSVDVQSTTDVMSDDGTTTSGSYSMAMEYPDRRSTSPDRNVNPDRESASPDRSMSLEQPAGDVYV